MDINRKTVQEGLRRARYITTEAVETVLFLALTLEKPLLIEGPAGAGKTEIGKVLAETLHTDLIRLQCYEGLDEAQGALRVELPEAAPAHPGGPRPGARAGRR